MSRAWPEGHSSSTLSRTWRPYAGPYRPLDRAVHRELPSLPSHLPRDRRPPPAGRGTDRPRSPQTAARLRRNLPDLRQLHDPRLGPARRNLRAPAPPSASAAPTSATGTATIPTWRPAPRSAAAAPRPAGRWPRLLRGSGKGVEAEPTFSGQPDAPSGRRAQPDSIQAPAVSGRQPLACHSIRGPKPQVELLQRHRLRDRAPRCSPPDCHRRPSPARRRTTPADSTGGSRPNRCGQTVRCR